MVELGLSHSEVPPVSFGIYRSNQTPPIMYFWAGRGYPATQNSLPLACQINRVYHPPWSLECFLGKQAPHFYEFEDAEYQPAPPYPSNCWQLCLEKGFFCGSSCWVGRMASLTFRPCYTFKCLWGIWISDEVFFFFFFFFSLILVPNMTSLHFGNEFLCIWMQLRIDLPLCSLSCKDVQKHYYGLAQLLSLLYLWRTDFKSVLRVTMTVGASAPETILTAPARARQGKERHSLQNKTPWPSLSHPK